MSELRVVAFESNIAFHLRKPLPNSLDNLAAKETEVQYVGIVAQAMMHAAVGARHNSQDTSKRGFGVLRRALMKQ